MNIVDMVGKKVGAVRFKKLDIPDYDQGVINGYNGIRIYAYKLPKDVGFITSVSVYGKTHVVVSWWSPGDKQPNSNYMPNDFEIVPLDGKEALEIVEGYEQYKLLNFWRNINKMGMNIGYSPEVFIENAGKIIPASEVLGKRSVKILADHRDSHTYYRGFKAQPWVITGTCLDGTTANLFGGLKSILEKARAKYPNANLSPKSLVTLDADTLTKANDDQVVFGDYGTDNKNIYGIAQAAPDYSKVLTRPASGPIHLGIGQSAAKEHTKALVRALDAVLGVACVSMFASFDNPKRREFVGAPGSYRIHSHGLEYKTLSNAWILHPCIQHLVVDLSRNSCSFGYLNYHKLWKATEQETIDTIMSCDVDKARDILTRNRDVFVGILRSIHHSSEEDAAMAYSIYLNGMESVLAEPLNIERNWGLQRPVFHDHRGQHHFRWINSRAAIGMGYKI